PMMDFLFNILSTNLRINFLNNQYSLLNIISVSMAFICVILGAALWKVVGIIVLLYVSSILSIIIALLMNKNLLKDIKEYTVLTKKEKNQFFKQSIFSSFSAASSNLMQMLDVFIIGIVISDAFIIADYKTATTIPSALYFISQAVMIYFYPYFAAKKDNQEWVKKTIILILIFLTATSIIIGAVFIPGAPFIMKIVFGEQYISCVPVFRILVVSVMIGNVFKSLCNNLMLAYKKATINFMFAFFDGGLNIIFDIVLIVKYGSIGAAYATLAITGVSSVVHFIVLLLVIKKHNKGITKNGNENSSNTILVDNGGDDEAMVNSFNT
ncbi:MAG: oligosaccharide flippase family protein, partial [Clostridia bacterium]